MGLCTPLPVYTTRKDADGRIGTYSMAAWMSLGLMFVAVANGFLWGSIGVYEAIKFVI